MNKEEQHVRLWKHTGYTMIIFLILLEWLIPLRELQEELEITSLLPILVVIGCSLLIGLLLTNRIVSLLLRSTVIVVTTSWIYGLSGHDRSSLFNVADVTNILLYGVTRLYTAVVHDISGLISALKNLGTPSWQIPSGEFRMLLLLIGVSALASIVQALVIKHHSILWFSGFTLLYLVMMQGLAQMNVSAGMIRLLAWTAVLASWLRLEEVTSRDLHYSRRAWPVRWWISTMAVSLGLLLGYMMWQQAYNWNRPLAWHGVEQWITQTAMAQKTNESTSRSSARTGYGEDDTQMGIPVQDDDTILFHARTPEPTYWKIETKRIYTGTGWVADSDKSISSQETASLSEQIDTNGRLTEELPAHQDKAWSEPFTQTIKLEQPLSAAHPLLFGGRPERLTMWLPAKEIQQEQMPTLHYDVSLERYRSAPIDKQEALSPADQANTLTYSYLTRTIKYPLSLRETDATAHDAPPQNTTGEDHVMTKELYQAYIELPDTLPERVIQLADEITQHASTQQDKVELIQAHLQQHYAYTKQETTQPPQGQDFVDHFLFDQRQGYCNHFSTAMVVLLRAEGIPARWVKGFTPGEAESAGNYIVRASDAHAWVEVYYPSAGWVPYEAVPPNSLAVLASSGSVSMPTLLPARIDHQGESGGIGARLSAWSAEAKTAIVEGGSKVVEAWETLQQQLQSEWSYLTDAQSWKSWFSLAELSSWNKIKAHFLVWWEHAPLSTGFMLLLMLGIWIQLFWWTGRAVCHVWPRWKLALYIRAQERSYTRERGYVMGELAWQLIERKYGARASNITYEQYTRLIADRLSFEEEQWMYQFAQDSTALLFARHQGERVQRQRFTRLCAEIIRMSKQTRVKLGDESLSSKRNRAHLMQTNKQNTKQEDRVIEV